MDRSSSISLPRNIAAEKFGESLDKRSQQELQTLAHIKRFLERYAGDPHFRDELQGNADGWRHAAERYAIQIDPRQALPLFHPDYTCFRFSEKVQHWPLAKLWADYAAEIDECREISRQAGDCPSANPRFHAWRQRQIRRCKSELGPTGSAITHPILAFELSAGCSIGCWFCGVSANRFQGNFLYTDANVGLWRSVLDQAVDLFGAATQTGFCYWATDPSDNPDYPKFIEDYYFATGSLPPMSTAAPLRDLGFTRKVLRLSDQRRCWGNRFSILTLRTLEAVHQTFTAEELLTVELLLQNRESLVAKVLVGRARERQAKRNDTTTLAGMATTPTDQSTIACVSGFLINMVSRTIQLITPTKATERWPLGYHVYGKRRFRTAPEFRAAIEDLIATYMPEQAASGDVLSFRDDLSYHRDPDGFELRTAYSQFALRGFEHAGDLGDLLHQGSRTAGEIHAALLRAGADLFIINDALQKLFDKGLLNEDFKRVGIAQTQNLSRCEENAPIRESFHWWSIRSCLCCWPTP